MHSTRHATYTASVAAAEKPRDITSSKNNVMHKKLQKCSNCNITGIAIAFIFALQLLSSYPCFNTLTLNYPIKTQN